MHPSNLEQAALLLMHHLHGHLGFPSPDLVIVLSRINTGAGRRVALKSSVKLADFSGYLDMAGHFIEMEGLENGMMATVSIVKGVITELEFSVYGDSYWDGEERPWSIQ